MAGLPSKDSKQGLRRRAIALDGTLGWSVEYSQLNTSVMESTSGLSACTYVRQLRTSFAARRDGAICDWEEAPCARSIPMIPEPKHETPPP